MSLMRLHVNVRVYVLVHYCMLTNPIELRCHEKLRIKAILIGISARNLTTHFHIKRDFSPTNIFSPSLQYNMKGHVFPTLFV